jgi:putative restriction endonuclease
LSQPQISTGFGFFPFFWPEELWIRDIPGWHANIQRGRTYNLQEGEGLAIWKEVVARLEATTWERGRGKEGQGELPIPGGYTDPLLQRRRIGQGTFSALIRDIYQRRCAVTQEKALPALEAAHIKPFADVEEHTVSNGILMRSDVHRLFDAGYITVTPGYQVEASRRMKEDFNDGENYRKLHGSRIWVPESELLRPDPAALQWHNEQKFRG